MAKLEDLMNNPTTAKAIESQYQYYTDKQNEGYKELQEARNNLTKVEKNQAKAPDYNKAAFNYDIKKYQDQITSAQNKINENSRKADAFQMALSNNNVEVLETTRLNNDKYTKQYQIINKETNRASNILVRSYPDEKDQVIQQNEQVVKNLGNGKYTVSLAPEQQKLIEDNKKAAEKLKQKQQTAAQINKQKQEQSPISNAQQKKNDKEQETIKKNNTPSEKEKEKFEQEKSKNIDTSDLPIPSKTKQGLAHSIDVSLIFADKQGTNWNITAYFKYITVWKLFEDSFKPIYKIGFNLPISLVKKIENSKNYKYRIIIKTNNYEFINRDLSLLPMNSDGEKMDKVIDLFLIPFKLPPNRCGAEVNKLLKNQDPKAKEMRLEYEVECFDINHVKSANSMVSCNYRNQKMKSIIIDLLNRYKKECLPNIKNLVLTEPDNTDTLYSITLQPGSLHDSIVNLHNMFHIYKKDIMIFLNDDTFYFIKRGFTPSYKNGKLDRVTIIIGGRDQINSNEGVKIYTLIKNSNEKEIIYFSDIDPVLEDNSAAILSDFGDKIIMKSDTSPHGLNSTCMGVKDDSDPMKSIKYADGNSLVNDAYAGKENFIVNNNDAPFNMDLLIDKAQREAYHASILLSDVNLSNFTPSTAIQLYFCDNEKKSFEGQWWIKSIIGLYSVNVETSELGLRVRLDLARKFGDDGKVIK